MCDRLAQYPFSRAKPRWFKRVLTGPGILGSDSSRLESRDCCYQDGRIDDASRRFSFLSGQRHKSSGPAAEENRISETVYRGRFDRLAKQRRGFEDVLLPKKIVDDLWLWTRSAPTHQPLAFIFPNTDGGFMD